MKNTTEKNAIAYGRYYYDIHRLQKAIAEEVRKYSSFWFSWQNCMEIVIHTAWDLGYRHLPGAIENELIRWLMKDFEG